MLPHASQSGPIGHRVPMSFLHRSRWTLLANVGLSSSLSCMPISDIDLSYLGALLLAEFLADRTEAAVGPIAKKAPRNGLQSTRVVSLGRTNASGKRNHDTREGSKIVMQNVLLVSHVSVIWL